MGGTFIQVLTLVKLVSNCIQLNCADRLPREEAKGDLLAPSLDQRTVQPVDLQTAVRCGSVRCCPFYEQVRAMTGKNRSFGLCCAS